MQISCKSIGANLQAVVGEMKDGLDAAEQDLRDHREDLKAIIEGMEELEGSMDAKMEEIRQTVRDLGDSSRREQVVLEGKFMEALNQIQASLERQVAELRASLEETRAD